MQIGCGLFGVLKLRSKYNRLIYGGFWERFYFLTFRQDGRRVANRICNPFCFQPRIMRSLLRVLSGGAAVENVSKNTGASWEIPGCIGLNEAVSYARTVVRRSFPLFWGRWVRRLPDPFQIPCGTIYC